MAPHCFKLSEGQVLAETMESSYRYLPSDPLNTIFEKINDLFQVCNRIEDEENVIDHVTIALLNIMQNIEEKNPYYTSYNYMSWLPSRNHYAVSLRSIINKLYEILHVCRNMDDGDEISEALNVLINQTKAFHPRSTMYLLGQCSRV